MSHDLGIDLVEAATKKLDVKVSYQENARDHRRNIRNSYKIDTPASAIQVAEKEFALLIKQVMIAMPVAVSCISRKGGDSCSSIPYFKEVFSGASHFRLSMLIKALIVFDRIQLHMTIEYLK